MELADPEIRNILVDESDEFIGLARQHAGFESRLEELAQKPAPTEEEWIEEIQLTPDLPCPIKCYRDERCRRNLVDEPESFWK